MRRFLPAESSVVGSLLSEYAKILQMIHTSSESSAVKLDKSALFTITSQSEIFVPKLHGWRRNAGRRSSDYNDGSKETNADLKLRSPCAQLAPETPSDKILEESAWQQIHNVYKFMIKPQSLTWSQFLAEQQKYLFRWEMVSSSKQVMTFEILKQTNDTNDHVSRLKLVCDFSTHNSMNDIISALYDHWHSKQNSRNTDIRFVDEYGSSSELILAQEGDSVSFFYAGDNNLCAATRNRHIILERISLSTVTRIFLDSMVTCLNAETFGFPNYKLCKPAHLQEIKNVWASLRAASCLQEEPLPVAENRIT